MKREPSIDRATEVKTPGAFANPIAGKFSFSSTMVADFQLRTIKFPVPPTIGPFPTSSTISTIFPANTKPSYHVIVRLAAVHVTGFFT